MPREVYSMARAQILHMPWGYSHSGDGQNFYGFRNPAFMCPEAVWPDGRSRAPWRHLGSNPHLATS